MPATLSTKKPLRYKSPGYPTRLEIISAPDLLAKHVPQAWLGRGELAGALGLMLALNSSGCTSDSPDHSPGSKQAGRTPATVAPIFEHGNGNTGERPVWTAQREDGVFTLGSFATIYPAYLTEEEALGVIRDELRKSGLNSFQTNAAISDLIIDGTKKDSVYDWASGDVSTRTRNISAPLQVDLHDPDHNINIEFISKDDFGPLGGDWDGKYYSDLKQAASALSTQVQRKGHDMRFAAFYDPTTYDSDRLDDLTPEADQKSENRAKAESKRLLRLQVQDFVNWLKAQGAI